LEIVIAIAIAIAKVTVMVSSYLEQVHYWRFEGMGHRGSYSLQLELQLRLPGKIDGFP
jgi:hypothetical protein